MEYKLLWSEDSDMVYGYKGHFKTEEEVDKWIEHMKKLEKHWDESWEDKEEHHNI